MSIPTVPHHGSPGKAPVTGANPRVQGHVQILTIHQAAGGNLRAFVDIQLGPSLVIRGFRIIQQAGQKAWVAPPQQEYEGSDGKRHYAPIVELTGDLKRRVEQAILAAWEGRAA